ncbi:hypothetical protein [Parashewanella tropica]|uniref:hypothetical protein n=1 Tax=Parashewanella tropica TaxID=2547970 RepID=UPI001059E962|nr:hypothetical protein [Parashewanella tropica]
MLWIISAIALGSLVFLYSRQTISPIAALEQRLELSHGLISSLVTIALTVFAVCFVITLSAPSIKGYTAISFAMTSVFIAIPKLHRFILPSAITTGVLLLSWLF